MSLQGEAVLWEPTCEAINCPLHPKEAAPPGRRRSPTRNAGSPPARGSPRRSKLEVANERSLKEGMTMKNTPWPIRTFIKW